ncbi:C69 family dipeptidase [Hallella bergensis]|uniref:dipeptidase n=1 Tax=Hallella bergensis TaxID=242750 RepID=UPI0023F39D08|nr:C69 family dipeptidase [Hallella bergensis]
MKRHILMAAFLLAATLAPACTNFIVGKKASADGSIICTYNADSYGSFDGLCHYPAGKHAKGTMRDIVDWESKKFIGRIAEAPETYNVIGNINEYQVTIGETTYGGREEMVDPKGGIDYGSLIYLGLQRSKTAREAIKVMTTLAETYGYCSEGETFTICDPREAWIMEMMGKGPGSKGVVWVAQRIPDNAICGHANQSRIGKFNMKDKDNVMYSKDVVKFARKMGWYSGKDADFNWKMTYAKPDFSGRRICDARVWAFFNRFVKGMDRYLPWAMGKDEHAEDMPLWVVPDRKLSVQDVEAAMRDHYEGTPMAMDSTDMGGGIWQMPYRPTPLFFEVDGKKYFNERPTSTQQTAFSYVAQMRSWLPRQIGGVLWFGNDDGNMVAYTPIYCGNTVQPECYNTPGADAVTFSMKNAFWVCNWVSNMVYPRYAMLFPSLKEVRDSLEQSYFARQKTVEDKALALYKSDQKAAIKYLNDYSNETAQHMLECWKDLATYLIVKYNDMTIKPEENGHFKRTPEGLGARVERPGFPQAYRRKLVETTGSKFEQ